jgi:nucleoporin NUP159
MTSFNDIRRQINNRKDPERTEALRKASLPKDLSDQQKALRTEYARLLSQLNQAEEAAMLLKSKLANANAANGKSANVPTVEAVKKTINKLIQMTEKKNNDILLLESDLRKLNLAASVRPDSPSSRAFGTPGRSSRALGRSQQTPLATSPTNRSRMSIGDLNRAVQTPEPEETPSRGYGLFYTPEGSPSQDGFGSLRRLADEMEAEDFSGFREASQRRKQVAKALAGACQGRGVKVTRVVQ